jgi:hypothetical protein
MAYFQGNYGDWLVKHAFYLTRKRNLAQLMVPRQGTTMDSAEHVRAQCGIDDQVGH